MASVPPLLLISPHGSRNEMVTRYELRNWLAQRDGPAVDPIV